MSATSVAEVRTLPELGQSGVEKVVVALAVGLLAYLASCVVLPQDLTTNNFGSEWQRMSMQPLAFLDPAHAAEPKPLFWFPHRLLAPLLAHLVGMGGSGWVSFTQLATIMLLALVYHVARWRGAVAFDAALVTLAVATTGAVQVYKYDMIGYVDGLGYSLTLLTWLSARRTVLFWTLILLNLCNHEMVAFFLPWFLFVRRQAHARISFDVIGTIAVLGLYAAFRAWIGAHVATTYDAGYFLEHTFLPITFLWLWSTTAVYQLQSFGPMLAIVIWHALRMRPGNERMHTLLIVGGFLVIFMFAYDVNRHSNMMMIPLIIASCRFLGDARSRIVYVLLILAAVQVNSGAFSTNPWTTDLPWLYDHFHLRRVFDWFNGVLIGDLHGNELILPANRFNFTMQWELLVGACQRLWPQMFALAWEALFLLALALWFARRGIGGSRVTTAGLVIPATPGGAADVFRRATAALWHRPRTRGPRVGT
jgi:hypothetical protein